MSPIISRRNFILGSALGAISVMSGCSGCAVTAEAETELSVFAESLIKFIVSETHGIALGVLGNCVYDVAKKENCPLLSRFTPKIISPAQAETPNQSFSMQDVEKYAEQYNADAYLCLQTARILGPKAVIDCLQGDGAIWYQKNETNYDDINTAKITIKNLTDSDISPRISIGLYDEKTGNHEINLIRDISPTINHRDKYEETISMSPKITLRPGFKSIRLDAFLTKKIHMEDIVFSKSVKVIVCPASVRYK